MPQTKPKAEKEKQPDANNFVNNALIKSRTILLTGDIDEKKAREVTAKLVALSTDRNEPILLILSSPGGHVESGDMIHDMIKFVSAPVKIIGTGWVASAGALIFCAAEKDNRFALPNTRFMLHEPRGGIGGQATDVEIQAREIIKMRQRLNKIFAEATGQSLKKIEADTDRDFWMSADEAMSYGLVGKVINSQKEIE